MPHVSHTKKNIIYVNTKKRGKNHKIQAREPNVLLDEEDLKKKKEYMGRRNRRQNCSLDVILFDRSKAFSVIKSIGFGVR